MLRFLFCFLVRITGAGRESVDLFIRRLTARALGVFDDETDNSRADNLRSVIEDRVTILSTLSDLLLPDFFSNPAGSFSARFCGDNEASAFEGIGLYLKRYINGPNSMAQNIL